jgi:glycosyltransferase involved in cell wall biosynthesis
MYQPLTSNVKSQNIKIHKNLEIYRLPWIRGTLFFDLEKYPVLEFLYLTPALFMFSLQFVTRRRKEIDVIHAHGLNASFIAKFLGRIFNKRVVTSVHTLYNAGPIMSNIFRWTFISSDFILALSERSKRNLMKLGIPETRIKISRQWVDQDKFKPLNRKNFRMEKGLDQKLVVLFVGRLVEEKGIKILLEVASKMDQNIVFLFLGDGPLGSVIKNAAHSHSNIVFVGKVSEEDLIKYYNIADVVVIPSMLSEGAPRVALEALSCGIPVLASNKGCLPDLINSNVGWLIEPSVKGFFEKILQILDDPSQLRTRSLNCRKYAETLFSEKNAQIIQESYGICRVELK